MEKFFGYCICLVFLISAGCGSTTTQKTTGEQAVLTLFVVRHAEAYQNLPFRSHMPREKQDSLTPNGLEQARRIGDYLKGKNITVVVASPTGRTRQTARIISEEVGLKGLYFKSPDFKSMKKGKTSDGKAITWSWRMLQWKSGHDPRPQGGESLQDATDRAVREIESLMKKYPGKVFVIVTHSDICAGLAGHVNNTPFNERYERHKVGLGSVIEIQITPQGTWALK